MIGLHGEVTGAGELKHKILSYRNHIIQTNIRPGKIYELKIFFVTDFKPSFLQPGSFGSNMIPGFALTNAKAIENYLIVLQVQSYWQATLLILILLFCLLYFLNKQEKVIAIIALVVGTEFLGSLGWFDKFLSENIVLSH